MPFNSYLSTGRQPADVPNGVHLPPMFSIVEPLERMNLITNPSFEYNGSGATGFGSSTLARIATDCFKGGACLRVTPTSTGSDGVFFQVAVVSGTTYAFSVYFKATSTGVGKRYRLGVWSGSAYLASRTFVGTAYWQRVWVPFTAASSTTLSFVVNKADHAGTEPFLTDAWQVEACEAGQIFPTTYIDGDQDPLVLRQAPPPYFWEGGPHISRSVRLSTTNAGGRIVSLDKIGFQLLGIEGLSSSFPDLQSVDYAELDGGELQRIRKQSRTFSLIGRLDADTFRRARSQFAGVVSMLDRDFSPIEQPIKLIFTPMDENGQVIPGDSANGYEIVCVYEGGLAGNINNFNTDVVTIQFRMFEPVIKSVQEYSSGEFTESQSFTIEYITARLRSGSWDDLVGGVTAGGNISSIVQHPTTGLIFVGGGFTGIGGSGADFCAIYDPVADTWTNVNSSDTTFNGAVEAIVVGPDGNVYIGGTFTNAGGVAAADGICRVSSTGSGLVALGTGITAGANSCVALAAIDNFIYAGGTFSTMGGIANTNSIARWNIVTAAWQAVGTGVTSGSGVRDIAGFGDYVYAVGNFAGMGGVANTTRIARFNSSTNLWAAMSTGADAECFAVVTDRNTGDVYIGGQFTAAGGQSINRLVKWDGYTYSALGPAGSSFGITSGVVMALHFDPRGRLWIVGTMTGFVFGDGTMDAVPGVLIWTGSAMLPGPLSNTTGNSGGAAIEITPGGIVYLGFTIADNIEIPTLVTCTNLGSARTYPTFRFVSSAASSIADIISLRNLTTERGVYSKFKIQQSERWIFNFDPRRRRLWSEYSGNIAGTLRTGSEFARMYLAPGDNSLEFLTDGALTGTGLMFWKVAYDSIDAVWPSALRGL